MQSIPIKYLPYVRENKLQGIFDNWGNTPNWLFAGTPSWLPPGPQKNLRQSRAGYGCRFVPDVYWQIKAKGYLFELKCSPSYEPLGLAEVLHHRNVIRKVSPGIHLAETAVFASYNEWLRASLDELHQNGLQRGILRLVECYYFKVPHLKKRLLWLDDPMDPWKADETTLPTQFPSHSEWKVYKHWYQVTNAKIWYGFQNPLPLRPVFIEQPLISVAAVDGREGEFVSCQMTPPPLGTNAQHRWNEKNLYWFP